MFELTNADAGDIAVTAAEGGIGYWAKIEQYNPRWYDPATYEPIDVPDTYNYYTLAEDNGAGHYDWDNPYIVSPAVIRRGWNRLIERWEKRSLNPFGFDPRELGSVDSNVADLIIQLGLFDEVRYG